MIENELRQFGIDVFDRWTAMWNRELPAEKVMAPEFTLRYAQKGADAINETRTPAEFEATLDAWHQANPGTRFTPDGTAAVDLTPNPAGPTGIVARPYLATRTVDGATGAVSGTDMLRLVDGLIVEVWSVSAAGRPFYG
jgi:hypothetical protein